MGRDTLPTEEEQLSSYAEVVKEFGAEAPVVIRTMDIGGDKELPILNLAKEDNPFLATGPFESAWKSRSCSRPSCGRFCGLARSGI